MNGLGCSSLLLDLALKHFLRSSVCLPQWLLDEEYQDCGHQAYPRHNEYAVSPSYRFIDERGEVGKSDSNTYGGHVHRVGFRSILMLEKVVDKTDAAWSVHTAYDREANANGYQHIVGSGPVHGDADEVPDEAADDQKVFPVEFVNLVAHDDPRDRVGGSKYGAADEPVLSVVDTQIHLEIIFWISSLTYICEEVLLPLCSNMNEEQDTKIWYFTDFIFRSGCWKCD